MIETAPKIIVGYRTRAAELPETFVPQFDPPANYKDPAKIAEWQAQRAAEWVETCRSYPYLGTFDAVHVTVLAPGIREVARWDYRPPGADKQPVCLAVRAFLMKYFGDIWTGKAYQEWRRKREETRLFYLLQSLSSVVNHRGDPAKLAAKAAAATAGDDEDDAGAPRHPIFLGFDPRTFLKMLGLECSTAGAPLPPSVWYATTLHRDVAEALMPAEFKHVPLAWVLKRRGIAVPGWERPGVDPELDARVVVNAADQLGFLTE